MQDYERARSQAPPDITVRRLGPLAGPERAGQRTVRAATLGRLADQGAVSLDHRVRVSVIGGASRETSTSPLTSGGTVVLTPAGERYPLHAAFWPTSSPAR